jgi:hypothetical protein
MIDGETKQKLLNEISKFGNVYLSCLKMGVDKATYYRWKQQDKEFRKLANQAEKIGRENICDVAEHSLLKNVKDGNQRSIEYTLGHNSKRYKRKKEDVVIVHKKDTTPIMREPSLDEILVAYDKLFEDKNEEKEEIKRIPPDYELEQKEIPKKEEIEPEKISEIIIKEEVVTESQPDSSPKNTGRRPLPRPHTERY